MKKIVLATNNPKKLKEMRAILGEALGEGYEIISLKESGFVGEIEENADSFEGNAYLKASAVLEQTGFAAIADDSGLEVDYLNGAPGIYSARYAGENATDDELIEKLLREMQGVPYSERTARFVSVICVVDGGGFNKFYRGECPGIIIEEKRGDGRFGYDPVFLYEPLNKTFAELEGEKKNAISHRGRAMQLLKKAVFDGEIFSNCEKN